jgi:hypothetical protein
MATLGSRLASKMIDQEHLLEELVIGDYTSRSRVFRIPVRLNVEWTMETRANAYTFVVGDASKSSLDLSKVGKTSWTEVAASGSQ